ncbi:MAG: transglycosylase family protein [Acidobacteria bacterium]|nr:transglycosylase family protein [Acidobacteriota bacterium]
MRRVVLTMLVALLGATAPGSPAHASTKHPAPRHAARNHLRLLSPWRLHQLHLQQEALAALGVVASHLHLTLQQLMSKWERVAVCEVNGHWNMEGPVYSGIGFLNINWQSFGGTHFGALAGDATPEQQVLIAMRITKTWIPDQYGCSPSGW